MQDTEGPKVCSTLLDNKKTFASCEFGLDRRLTKAVAKLRFVHATLVQIHCIPLALQGKDLLVRARTGSGKTAAYALPLLQKILTSKVTGEPPSVKALVLVPTKELVQQVYQNIGELMYYCKDVVSILALGGETLKAQQARLRDVPDIVVATPGRLVQHLEEGNVELKQSVQTLVIDEADLVLSYGYEKDIRSIFEGLPRVCQSFFMSATLSPELNQLKRAVLHNAAVVKLEEDESEGKLQQFYLPIKHKDKDLLLYALLKLGLLQGKVLFFTNSTESSYRLKLFFEQFSIKAAVLNAKLPLNSRQHTIMEFNKGIFDYLIATDDSIEKDLGVVNDVEVEDEDKEEQEDNDTKDSEEEEDADEDDEDEEEDNEDEEEDDEIEVDVEAGRQKRESYGVARGVDFRGVNFVVNVDFPQSVNSYIHRIGRTARGGASGTAVSLISEEEAEGEWKLLHKVQAAQAPAASTDAENSSLQAQDGTDGSNASAVVQQPAPLAFDVKEVDCFRYRVEDVRRAVTAIGVREAMLQAVKNEMFNSEKLEAYFEDNPTDLNALQHDKVVGKARVQPHLATIPSYLVPEALQAQQPAKGQKRRGRGGRSNDKRRRTSNDPLHTFEHNGEGEKEDRITYGDSGLGQSTSNRQRWQAKHGRGKFSKKKAAYDKRKSKGFNH